ncbi:MAG: XTP/dITP diphosphohydrolase [Candidatus Omnitrophota bacterium]|jgi:XTP/dITP diphosphohydrolase
MQILVATGNTHKLEEIRGILQIPSWELVGLDQLQDPPEVDEDGDTFEANAAKKARELALFSGMWTLADDSGLEVDALDGAPGVFSARFGGVHGDNAANNARLLKELEGSPNRQARFRCVLALASPQGEIRCVSGAVAGTIAQALSGTHGFGYDPLFIPTGYEKTFAELPASVKARISHRAEACKQAAQAWSDLF